MNEQELVPTRGSIAVPADTQPAEVDTEVVGIINDDILGEPFTVRMAKTGRRPWWTDLQKVQKLLGAFQHQASIIQACISAGISYPQYLHFCEMHPEFQYLKDRCMEVFGLQAKLTVGKGMKKDHWLAWEYLKGQEPDKYGTKLAGLPVPEGGAVATVVHQSMLDGEGNVIMSKETAEYLKLHGDKYRDKPNNEPGANQ